LLIVLSLLCRPGLALPMKGSGQYPLLWALAAAALILIGMMAIDMPPDSSLIAAGIAFLLGLTVNFWRAPLPFAAILAFVVAVHHYVINETSILSVRNFFGVLRVVEFVDGKFHSLYHGIGVQGTQRFRDDDGKPLKGRPEMIAEFFGGGGIAQVFDALRARVAGPINFAVVGLGTGTLACQVQVPGDAVTYYEIDPDVVRIAHDPKMFTYVSECAPNARIVLGDARLRLADAPDGSYDLIMIDAFQSAMIPIHLLTREAMAVYLRKIKPNGIVALHVGNRNLELPSVVAGIAQANGAIARVYDGGDVEGDDELVHIVPRVAVVARQDADFGPLAQSEYWPVRDVYPNQRVWTDDYSNIVGSMLRRLRETSQ
jgi:SAM-dependent methyltransferase